MDDGEKFGGWPDTYKWVYEEGWLEKFFTALEENRLGFRSGHIRGIRPAILRRAP